MTDRDDTGVGEEPELFERQGDLAAVELGVAAAVAGRGRLLWIEGPAGIGKTELVRRARRTATRAGLRVCAARGGELEREFPFGIVRQLFEGGVGELEPGERHAVLSGPARHAGGALGVPEQDEVPADVLPLLHGLYWLTANLAGMRPLLIAVDDVHWADAVSLRYLDYLARRLDDLPVLAVLAARPAEPHGDPDLLARIAMDPNVHAIRPSPLSEEAVTRLVAASLRGPGDAEFSRACLHATGGNPFLLRHLLATLRDEGVVSAAACAPRALGAAPGGVMRATRIRLASLPADAARLVDAVAVLGDGAPLAQAAALAGSGPRDAATASDQLAAIGILRPSRPLAFVHPLVRSAIYDDIAAARRSGLHRRAAEILAGAGSSPDRIAAQLLQAEPAGDAWVVDRLRAGADSALAAGDPVTAGRMLQRAVAEPAAAELQAALLCELGVAELRSASPAAIDHLRHAHELATDTPQRVDILRLLMLALLSSGRSAEVEHLLDPTVEAATAVDPDLALQVEAEVLSVARLSARREIWGRRRLERWRGRVQGRTPGERLLLASLCIQRAISGSTAEEAASLAEQAIGDGALLDEQTTDAMPFYQAVYVVASAGRLDRATRLLDAARTDAVARGSQLGFAAASLFRSLVDLAAGRVGEAEADGTDALRAASDDHLWAAGLPACVAALVDVFAVQGRAALAERLLEDHGLSGALPDSVPHRVLLHSRGQLRLVAGDPERALDDFDEFDRREAAWATLNPWLNNHRHGAVHALAHVGRVGDARERARTALAAARQWGTDQAVGRAERALASVSPPPDAEAQLADAVARLAASPGRLDHAGALVELGALRRRSGARQAAEATLRDGLDLASRLGASLIAERARTELVAMGRRPRRAAITGIDALTGSERRVADLAVRGLTNREIAQSLFVTTRTVEIHLSSVYRKLGIKARSGLKDALSPPDEATGAR